MSDANGSALGTEVPRKLKGSHMKKTIIGLLAFMGASIASPALACLGYAPGSCVWVDTSSYGSWSATPALGAPNGYPGSLTFWGARGGNVTLAADPVATNIKLSFPAASGTLLIAPLPLTSLAT